MRRPNSRSEVPHLIIIIGAALAAVGFFLFRATWDRADEVIIRQPSEDWRPWHRGDEIRVRLDLDRLRANGLSREDVIKALKPSSMVDPDPPPGVVFETRLSAPKRYENIILKANAEGEIVRLKDVAKLEAGW